MSKSQMVNVEHLIKGIETQVRTLVKDYTDAKIQEALQPIYSHVETLYESITELAEQVNQIGAEIVGKGQLTDPNEPPMLVEPGELDPPAGEPASFDQVEVSGGDGTLRSM